MPPTPSHPRFHPQRFLTLGATLFQLTCPIHAQTDLSLLSDEFDHPASQSRWLRIHQVEGWNRDVLQTFDIHSLRPDHLTLIPHSSSWYQEWQGELTFQTVSGDFVLTTHVEPRNRTGTGAPQASYSLAGLMLRAPRPITHPDQWTPGGQNYVFLSLGTADLPGTYQFEVKTTTQSTSILEIQNQAPPSATLQAARIGPHLILLRRHPNGPWQVHRRYFRPDFPDSLQAGVTVYTDWNLCEQVGYEFHNLNVLTNGLVRPGQPPLSTSHPDLIASFDFLRYARPAVPLALAGADLSNPQAVSDAQLLEFLGDPPNIPGGASIPPLLTLKAPSGDNPLTLNLSQLIPGRTYRIRSSTNLTHWTTHPTFISTHTIMSLTDLAWEPQAVRYFQIASP